MGLIVILPFAALAGWSIFALARWLRRGGYGPKWWRAFAILALIGLGLGIWFAFFLHYHVANTRLATGRDAKQRGRARKEAHRRGVPTSARPREGRGWVDEHQVDDARTVDADRE